MQKQPTSGLLLKLSIPLFEKPERVFVEVRKRR